MAELKEIRSSKITGFSNKLLQQRQRLVNKDGSFNVGRKNFAVSLDSLFHFLVETSWLNFSIIVGAFYVLLNLFFALAYYFIGIDQITNVGFSDSSLHPFFICFNYSVQTFTTVGYGTLHPTGATANIVSNIEAMSGLLTLSIASGLLFARFSKPNAKILFSKKALIGPYKSHNSLQFRIVNKRFNQLTELEAQLTLAISLIKEGKQMPRFYNLKLETDRINFFPLNWTIVHKIDEQSPLWNKDHDFLINHHAEFIVNIKAFDDSLSQKVHTRYSYLADELVWGAKFKLMYELDENGFTVLDLSKLDSHELIPINN